MSIHLIKSWLLTISFVFNFVIYFIMDVNTSTDYCSPQNSNDETNLPVNSSEPDTSESELNEDEIDVNEYHIKLKERLVSLRASMQDLKKQLKEEKENWKKEMEFVKLHSQSVVAPAVSSDSSNEDIPQKFSYDYHHQYESFEDALNRVHKESRVNLQRQIAISNYKRRLMEVENMCNLELLRVKQNVQFLMPLQMIASEWNCDKDMNLNEAGDVFCEKTNSSDMSIITSGSEESKQKEVAMPLEMISNKLYTDMNDMFNKVSAQCNDSMTQLYCGNWPNENQKTQSRSAVWYNDYVAAKQN